jgi:hypothetical protein
MTEFRSKRYVLYPRLCWAHTFRALDDEILTRRSATHASCLSLYGWLACKAPQMWQEFSRLTVQMPVRLQIQVVKILIRGGLQVSHCKSSLR